MGQWTRLAQMTHRVTAGVFGESATLTIGGTDYEIDGEFDAPSTREETAGGEVLVIDEPARISVRTEQFTGPITVRTDTVTVRGTEYRILEVRPDGTGALILILGRG